MQSLKCLPPLWLAGEEDAQMGLIGLGSAKVSSALGDLVEGTGSLWFWCSSWLQSKGGVGGGVEETLDKGVTEARDMGRGSE